ncbi:hypothetical protein SFRURICE_002780 [Spodoptera frugiperda]|nr:hypothetical protein SFRURICE_002780 [Spodoptera frugiperda]
MFTSLEFGAKESIVREDSRRHQQDEKPLVWRQSNKMSQRVCGWRTSLARHPTRTRPVGMARRVLGATQKPSNHHRWGPVELMFDPELR